MPLEILDVLTPERWDDDSEGARLLRELVDVRNAVVAAGWDGDRQFDLGYQEAWGAWRNRSADQEEIRTIAVLDGVTVGRGFASRGVHEGTDIAEIDAMVLPEFRRRGIGSVLFTDLRDRMIERGVTTFQSWVDHHPREGATEYLSPPTGFGAVPLENPEVQFQLHFGFRLEQIYRASALDLPEVTEQLSQWLTEAEAHALPNYRLATWRDDTPAEHVAGLAALHARMSVDAPSAALDLEEERWDAERLRRYEASRLEGGKTLFQAVAIDEATQELVAYTMLEFPREISAAPDFGYQIDTLVHGEHRGHRLGTLVKVGNLIALAAERPNARIATWNAEENRPMLSVNEAMGFRTISQEGAWQWRTNTASEER